MENKLMSMQEAIGRFVQDGDTIVTDCLKAGLLINCTAHRVLRFTPPLTIGKKEIEQGLAILEQVLARQ